MNQIRPATESSGAEIDVVPPLVGLPAVEEQSLNLPPRRVHPARDHAEREVCRIQPMVRDRRHRIGHGGDPMGKAGRAERGLAGESGVRVPPDCADQRPIALGRQLHEDVVRMLFVVNGVAVAHLAGCQQIRISATADRPGLEAEHATHADGAATQRAPSHQHEPIDAARLRRAPVLGRPLVQELQKHVAVHHDLPAARSVMEAVHRRRIRQPGCAGGFPGVEERCGLMLVRCRGWRRERRCGMFVLRRRRRGEPDDQEKNGTSMHDSTPLRRSCCARASAARSDAEWNRTRGMPRRPQDDEPHPRQRVGNEGDD